LRRADREIKDRAEIDDILNRGRVCSLGLCEGGVPYVVPVNYGYADGCLYIHSAREGRKIDILRMNNLVSFAIFVDYKVVPAEKACSFTSVYRSVMGTGRASLLEGREEKEQALRIIMRHYSDGEFEFEPQRVDQVAIIKVEVDSLMAKSSGRVNR